MEKELGLHSATVLYAIRRGKKTVTRKKDNRTFHLEYDSSLITIEGKAPRNIKICVNDIWYNSLSEMNRETGLSIGTVRSAIQEGRKVVTRTVDKQSFTLKYDESLIVKQSKNNYITICIDNIKYHTLNQAVIKTGISKYAINKARERKAKEIKNKEGIMVPITYSR